MIKKMMWGFAATALVFSSCSKDNETAVNTGVNPNAIGLTVSTGVSRASDNTLQVLQASSSGFGVVAKKKNGGVTHIDNKKYKYVGSDWEWADAGNDSWKLWPTAEADYPMDFYGYYPTGSTGTLDAVTLAQSYTILDEPNQIDLLAASKKGVLVRPVSGKVSMDFKHITSKIQFQVLTGPNTVVIVQSIAIKNVGKTRDFNYSGFEWGNEPSNFSASYEYLHTKKPADSCKGTSPINIIGTNGPLMLMPQNLSSQAWDAANATGAPTTESYIEVVYRVVEKASGDNMVGYDNAQKHPGIGSSSNPASTSPLFVKVAFSLPTKWERSKAYTYILYLGRSDGSGGNLIDDKFIDEDGKNTDLGVVHPNNPTDPNNPEVPIDVPDPIVNLKKPIGFDVDVKDWGNSSNIGIQ